MSAPTRQRWGRTVSSNNYQRRESVDVRLARELGVKPSTAHQLLYSSENGLRRKMIAVIRILGESPNLFAHWWYPIEEELQAVRGYVDTNQVVDLKAQADANEAVVRQRWTIVRGEMGMWERALERQIEWCFRCIAKIHAKRGVHQ